jgi:hypothetical protein
MASTTVRSAHHPQKKSGEKQKKRKKKKNQDGRQARQSFQVHMSAAPVEGVASSSGGGGGGMPGGLSAKQQKLFELRMRMVCAPAALLKFNFGALCLDLQNRRWWIRERLKDSSMCVLKGRVWCFGS